MVRRSRDIIYGDRYNMPLARMVLREVFVNVVSYGDRYRGGYDAAFSSIEDGSRARTQASVSAKRSRTRPTLFGVDSSVAME